jgi:hypothetical protein
VALPIAVPVTHLAAAIQRRYELLRELGRHSVLLESRRRSWKEEVLDLRGVLGVVARTERNRLEDDPLDAPRRPPRSGTGGPDRYSSVPQ